MGSFSCTADSLGASFTRRCTTPGQASVETLVKEGTHALMKDLLPLTYPRYSSSIPLPTSISAEPFTRPLAFGALVHNVVRRCDAATYALVSATHSPYKAQSGVQR
jgi:hypothetical protein